MYKKHRDEYDYEVYLIHQPDVSEQPQTKIINRQLFYLSNEEVVDIHNTSNPPPFSTTPYTNLHQTSGEKGHYLIEMNSEYFKHCFQFIKPMEANIRITIRNRTGQFLEEIEISSEKISLESNCLIIQVDQSIHNRISRAKGEFLSAVEAWKANKIAFIREQKFAQILD